MIDVLVFLFENYFDISTHPESDTLARKLSAAGFDPEEVSFALDWLDELKQPPRMHVYPDRAAFARRLMKTDPYLTAARADQETRPAPPTVSIILSIFLSSSSIMKDDSTHARCAAVISGVLTPVSRAASIAANQSSGVFFANRRPGAAL